MLESVILPSVFRGLNIIVNSGEKNIFRIMTTELGNSSLQLGNNDCFAGRVSYPPLRVFLLHRLARFSDDKCSCYPSVKSKQTNTAQVLKTIPPTHHGHSAPALLCHSPRDGFELVPLLIMQNLRLNSLSLIAVILWKTPSSMKEEWHPQSGFLFKRVCSTIMWCQSSIALPLFPLGEAKPEQAISNLARF